MKQKTLRFIQIAIIVCIAVGIFFWWVGYRFSQDNTATATGESFIDVLRQATQDFQDNVVASQVEIATTTPAEIPSDNLETNTSTATSSEPLNMPLE